MQRTRETRRSCKRAHECTPKHIPALPPPLHPPSKTLPKVNATTQSPHNSNPPSSLNIDSRGALQHVRFQLDKSFHASHVTSKRCNRQRRHALPANARMSAHQNTSLSLPPAPHPFPLKTLPKLNNATQSPHNSNPQSNFNIDSRVTLQHVCLERCQFFHAVQMAVLRSHVQR